MAEFCKKCAPKYGMRPETDIICEGCGDYVYDDDNNLLFALFAPFFFLAMMIAKAMRRFRKK